MNFALVLIAIPMVSGAIAIYLVLKERRSRRRTFVPRRRIGNARRVQLRSVALVPVGAIVLAMSACRPAHGQEVIYARAGQVVAINPTARTLTLKVANGPTVLFRDVVSPEPAMSFDKDVRKKTVAVNTFKNVGAYVVVFYFGFDAPTAVAVEDLGISSLRQASGSVSGFDRHQHLLMLKTGPAEPQKIVVSDDTIVDTPEGVIKPANFHPKKGEQLRCFTTSQAPSAVFIAPN